MGPKMDPPTHEPAWSVAPGGTPLEYSSFIGKDTDGRYTHFTDLLSGVSYLRVICIFRTLHLTFTKLQNRLTTISYY